MMCVMMVDGGWWAVVGGGQWWVCDVVVGASSHGCWLIALLFWFILLVGTIFDNTSEYLNLVLHLLILTMLVATKSCT